MTNYPIVKAIGTTNTETTWEVTLAPGDVHTVITWCGQANAPEAAVRIAERRKLDNY